MCHSAHWMHRNASISYHVVKPNGNGYENIQCKVNSTFIHTMTVFYSINSALNSNFIFLLRAHPIILGLSASLFYGNRVKSCSFGFGIVYKAYIRYNISLEIWFSCLFFNRMNCQKANKFLWVVAHKQQQQQNKADIYEERGKMGIRSNLRVK